MIWFALAYAAAPEDLLAAMPAAREQLESCESKGCTAEEGSRAAFLVALGTYLESGEADGRLAATVKALDPARFEDLPDVLQASVSEPAPWVADLEIVWSGNSPIAGTSVRFERIRLSPVQPNPLGLTILVEDPAGAPVPAAMLRLKDDPSGYRVDPTSGWSGGGRRVGNTTELFERDQMVAVSLTAPGFERTSAMIRLAKNPKKNRFTLRMAPLVPAADGSEESAAVVDAWATWTRAEQAAADARTAETEETAERARVRAARAAKKWSEAGGESAMSLCEATGLSEVCDPS